MNFWEKLAGYSGAVTLLLLSFLCPILLPIFESSYVMAIPAIVFGIGVVGAFMAERRREGRVVWSWTYRPS